MPARTANAPVELRVHGERVARRASRPRRSRAPPRASRARAATHGVGSVRRDLERLGQHLLGVARVVLVEVEVGAPEERLDCAAVQLPPDAATRRARSRCKRGWRPWGAGAGASRGPTMASPSASRRGDRVGAVLVGELQEQRLGVGAAAARDEELAEHEAHAPRAGAGRVAAAGRGAGSRRRPCPARRGPSPRSAARRSCGCAAPSRCDARALRVGEAPLLEHRAREPSSAAGRRPPNRRERLLGRGVVATVPQRVERRGLRGGARRRRPRRAADSAAARRGRSTAPSRAKPVVRS